MMTLDKDYVRVPYAMTVHGEQEIEAVVRVLRSSTQMGKHTREFESKIAAQFAKKHGIGVNSGSSALFLAMEALGLPKGSEVITPALTFATTVGCIVKNGLVPAFVDVEPDTFVVNVDRIEEMVTEKTRAMCIPNLLGNIPDWERIAKIAQRHDLRIIEDSADIVGATINGKSTGTYSDISTTSFYGMHLINCAGNGGMVCTSNDAYADKVRLLRSWGRSSSLFVESERIENRFNIDLDGIQYDAKFVFEEIGYNLEPAELGCAFGLVQMQKLGKIYKHRKWAFDQQYACFNRFGWFDMPRQTPNTDMVWFVFPMLVKQTAPFSRTDLQIFLEKRNIQTRVIFTGNILRQPGFRNIERREAGDGYPVADDVMRRGVLLACHHGLTQEMLDHVHSSFDEFARQYR
jgi:CDP-6-deoxy-D-xylo-4-hexulose-3-dehydrase